MIRAIVIAALLGQTIYEWTDSKGQTHFTNDASTIPANAKRKPTEGSNITVESQVAAAQPVVNARVDAGVPDAGVRNTCRALQAEVSSLEGLLQNTAAQGSTLELDRRCQEQLNLHGQGAWALCRMSGADASTASATAQDVRRELEGKRDALRRAQVSGCR